jgi:hypothetical protein
MHTVSIVEGAPVAEIVSECSSNGAMARQRLAECFGISPYGGDAVAE